MMNLLIVEIKVSLSRKKKTGRKGEKNKESQGNKLGERTTPRGSRPAIERLFAAPSSCPR